MSPFIHIAAFVLAALLWLTPLCLGDTLHVAPDSLRVAAPAVADSSAIPEPGTFARFEVPPEPLPKYAFQPEFPDSALAFGMAGKVVVQVYVDRDGIVRKWKIAKVEPAGYGFEKAVLDVIPHWRFTPAIQGGKPIGVWVAVPFNFKYRAGDQGYRHTKRARRPRSTYW
jgi:TonB family protein